MNIDNTVLATGITAVATVGAALVARSGDRKQKQLLRETGVVDQEEAAYEDSKIAYLHQLEQRIASLLLEVTNLYAALDAERQRRVQEVGAVQSQLDAERDKRREAEAKAASVSLDLVELQAQLRGPQ